MYADAANHKWRSVLRDSALIYPMFAMVALSFGVLVILFRSRLGAVRAGAVSKKYFAVYQGETEPDYVLKSARHFANLFETPVLFYAACLAALATHQASSVMLGLAWAYVLCRVVHALIHIGPNPLRPRIYAYFASWFVLLAMWITLAFLTGRSA
jgi:hypothetical protein